MFAKPLSKQRFDKAEEAQVISLQQMYCTHHLEIDEEIEQHQCTQCGKQFTSHEALLYVLHANDKTKMSSYNLRNEIHFLTQKRDEIQTEIENLRKDKRLVNKQLKSLNKDSLQNETKTE